MNTLSNTPMEWRIITSRKGVTGRTATMHVRKARQLRSVKTEESEKMMGLDDEMIVDPLNGGPKRLARETRIGSCQREV
jgi:hypothetical protein